MKRKLLNPGFLGIHARALDGHNVPCNTLGGVRCVDLSSTAVTASVQAPIILSLPTDLTFLSSPPIPSPHSSQEQFPCTEAKCWQRGKRRQRVIPYVRTESGMLGGVRINGTVSLF